MRHSILVKFLTVLLAAGSLVAAIGGGAGIVAMESSGLYVSGPEVLQEKEYDSVGKSIASAYAQYYAVENKSNLTYALREDLYLDPADRWDTDHWAVTLRQGDEVLQSSGDVSNFAVVRQYTLAPVYPIVSIYAPNEQPDSTTNKPLYGNVEVPKDYLYYEAKTSWTGGSLVTYYFYYFEAGEYTLTVHMQPEVLDSSALYILTNMYPHRYTFIIILAVGLLLFVAALVHLLWSAGRTEDGAIHPAGPNRLPIDLYALLALLGGYGLCLLLEYLIGWMQRQGPHPGNLSILAVNLMTITLMPIGFLTAFAAQIKEKGFLWKQSLVGRLCRLLFAGLRLLVRGVTVLFALMPMIWQWFAGAAVLLAALAVTALIAVNGSVVPLILVSILCVAAVLYSTYAFGVLLAGAKRMAAGELDAKITSSYLIGIFDRCAAHMNALAEVAVVAAEKQMRSDRMRAELIANVSHDIKTPLTSIINYVDLLQNARTQEETAQYLEVLGRQSLRMKKLIEDLVEMSKVSTGNITVEIGQADAAEAVEQALGEFSDKLGSAGLIPVFERPEQSVPILADGRLLWRVLSNLLSNAVKYALPGTRIYIDLVQLENQVLLSVKNVSREKLNMSADELTERFVRGDTSRNTEGSGLGLHIAKTLMELQKGQLHLRVDGDLFKVTLVFPAGSDS